ncbi:MAG: protein phosphatase 2C domain-containing protein [Gemmatimonadetes bacterium]|nr:protein phosphatase 2C domain-containing protein [Gemmatimonadota bacterium]
MNFEFAGLTDQGRVRSRNEDALLQRPERGLFAVADGMGGHAGGDVASRIAVDVLDEHLLAAGPDPDPDEVVAAIRAAHQAILRAARAESDLEGMGTTLTAIRVRADGCLIAHVGDSRAYRLRNGSLEQLTRDQTWVQDQVDAGLMRPDQARHHPFAAMITCALGIADVELDVQLLQPPCEPGDLFLLCSDGLTAGLEDAEIADVLAGREDLDGAARALIDAANGAGGPDNITVALVRFGGSAE